MAYTTKSEVRDLTGITESEIGNDVLDSLIDRACTYLNNILNVRHDVEEVEYIDTERENKINSSNTEFYTKDWPIGDKTDDFSVGTADLTAWTIDSNGARTYYTVSNINDSLGSVGLASAPGSNESLYFEYDYIPTEISNDMINEAATFLAASYAMTRLHGRGYKEYSLGSLKIKRDKLQVGEPFKSWAFELIEMIRDEKISIKEVPKYTEVETVKKDSPRVL